MKEVLKPKLKKLKDKMYKISKVGVRNIVSCLFNKVQYLTVAFGFPCIFLLPSGIIANKKAPKIHGNQHWKFMDF